MTSLMTPPPAPSRTLRLTMLAPGAMPAYALRVVAVAGDDAGDVGPVAVVVVGLQAIVDEVDEAGHALAADHANTGELPL
jgi:hypothetical protein